MTAQGHSTASRTGSDEARVRAQLTRHERYMHHHMMAHGMPQAAHGIAYGLPSDDEDTEMTEV